MSEQPRRGWSPSRGVRVETGLRFVTTPLSLRWAGVTTMRGTGSISAARFSQFFFSGRHRNAKITRSQSKKGVWEVSTWVTLLIHIAPSRSWLCSPWLSEGVYSTGVEQKWGPSTSNYLVAPMCKQLPPPPKDEEARHPSYESTT